MQNKFRIERLSNGLVKLYDPDCQWDVIYNPNVTWCSGGTDASEYRHAVRKFMAEEYTMSVQDKKQAREVAKAHNAKPWNF